MKKRKDKVEVKENEVYVLRKEEDIITPTYPKF